MMRRERSIAKDCSVLVTVLVTVVGSAAVTAAVTAVGSVVVSLTATRRHQGVAARYNNGIKWPSRHMEKRTKLD